MSIDLEFYGQFIVFFIIAITPINYYLAKRKARSANKVTLLSVLLSFIPPLALFLMAVLMFKKDTPEKV